jgi:carbon-monoxide dehydrogenase medium subunit
MAVFPNQFDYHRPESVQAAASLLAADPDAKLLAGGHSLLPAMKLRLASPSSLVDLSGIDGLVGIDA